MAYSPQGLSLVPDATGNMSGWTSEASSVPIGQAGRVKSIAYCRVGEVGPVLPFIFLYPLDNDLLKGPEQGMVCTCCNGIGLEWVGDRP